MIISMKTVVMICCTGFGFGWLMAATDCRPVMPLVKYMIWAGGGAA